MSRQFKVDSIFSITQATNHFDEGAVFARVGSEIYRYNMPIVSHDPKAWPLTLFRDHWSFFCDLNEGPHGTYFEEVIQAPRTIIKGQVFEMH